MSAVNLMQLLSELGALTGEDFLKQLGCRLNRQLEAALTLIVEPAADPLRLTTVVAVANGRLLEPFDYPREGTPCVAVMAGEAVVVSAGFPEAYPQAQIFLAMDVESYIGVPLLNTEGQCLGVLACLYEQPIDEAGATVTLLQAVAGRIAAELSQTLECDACISAKLALEQRLNESKHELAEARDDLTLMRNQIIEHEKLASLGQMVPGVTHDVNTPLGVAILGASTSHELLVELKQNVAAGKLTKSKLETSLSDLLESTETMEYNLQRAAKLIKNFKQIAVEYNTDQQTQISINQWLETLLTSLRPMMKKHGVTLSIHWLEHDLQLLTYPSKLAQLITNLLSNAAIHGFPEECECRDKKVQIELRCDGEQCQLSVTDNGVGMDAETKARILEPYYTTRRGRGGTGLGMNIVQSIVNDYLKGELTITSEQGKGACICVTFPFVQGESELDHTLDL